MENYPYNEDILKKKEIVIEYFHPDTDYPFDKSVLGDDGYHHGTIQIFCENNISLKPGINQIDTKLLLFVDNNVYRFSLIKCFPKLKENNIHFIGSNYIPSCKNVEIKPVSIFLNNLNDCNYDIKKYEPIAELAFYRTGLETNAGIQTTDVEYAIDKQFRQFKTLKEKYGV